jgi:hypothetical protein
LNEVFEKINDLCDFSSKKDSLYFPEWELFTLERCYSFIMEEVVNNEIPSFERVILRIEQEIAKKEQEVAINIKEITKSNLHLKYIIEQLAIAITSQQPQCST